MVFSSLTFLVFFLPGVVLLYFVSKKPLWRNAILAIASLLFYGWGEPKLVLLMMGTVMLNYLCGIGMDKSHGWKRLLLMIVGVGLSIAVLVYYKYAAFLGNSILALLRSELRISARTLPIGISFYTFQMITYTVDVYRKKVPAQYDFLKLTLYISFFPQLIAGPIVNYTDIEPQLAQRRTTKHGLDSGMHRFMVGLGKKVILANTLGKLLEQLTLTGNPSMLAAWLGAIAYTMQIYFDFSGYSDMAIGLGKIFGFEFSENFRYPYLAESITDFWRRWHISLGTFFRDYVYIPLGGNHVPASRHIFNLMVVWMLTGLWHGASWSFIVWGAYYGVLLILEKYVFARVLKKLPSFLRHLISMLLIIFGWVLFYHESLTDGLHQLGVMVGILPAELADGAAVYCLKAYLWVLVLGCFAACPWDEWLQKRTLKASNSLRRAFLVADSVYLAAIYALSLLFLIGSGFNPFLYFRF